MKTILPILFLLCVLIGGQAHARNTHAKKICGNFHFQGKTRVLFTPEEKKLICGDNTTDSWKKIPPAQAKFHIKVFLQSRGYFFPSFHSEKNNIYLDPGEVSTIKSIKISGNPPAFFNINKLRKIKKHPLTPKRLDEIAGWTKKQLSSRGYACPKIEMAANAKTEQVLVHVVPGPKQNVVAINTEDAPGLNEKNLRRYDAFLIGKPYNQKWIELSAERTKESGILESTYFVEECHDDGVHLTQKNVAGRPRLFRMGFGLNTEEYALTKISWQHGRLWKNSSRFKASLYASYIRQQFDVELEHYPFKPGSRFYLNPTLSITREFYNKDGYLAGDLGLTPAYVFDNQHFQLKFLAGPSMTFTQTFEGAASGFSKFISGFVQINLLSHGFEYNIKEPKSGYELIFTSSFSHKDLFSDVTVQKFSLEGHKLWNIDRYSPPLLVLGVRGALNTSLTDTGTASFSNLPPNYLFYLGGSENLRAFNRDELSAGTRGALTTGFLSLEARLGDVLPLNIQPFAFVDAGMIGANSFSFEPTVYLSPGGGLRIASPIGVFRGTLAHGMLFKETARITSDLSHWQFYLSFGEEF